jgi:catechol 2,3-dioxygenase-like lactoylglutathione lyase family enzyme
MRPVAHLGISVPDIEAAVDWYCKVFGFELMLPIGEVDASAPGPISELCADIFGEGFGGMKLAHLASANNCAVELFQFLDPPYEKDQDFAYWRGGIFHFAVVASDVERVAHLIEEHGGRRRSMIAPIFEGKPVKACYCQDPWGTVIEVISHSHERAFSNMA